MKREIYLDIKKFIETENLERLSNLKKFKGLCPKIKILKTVLNTNKFKCYLINGLAYKKDVYDALLIIYSDSEFIGETEGGLSIYSPVHVQIALLRKIKPLSVTPEGLTEEEVHTIKRERRKPKRMRGDYSFGDYCKSINQLSKILRRSNRIISAYCKRVKI